MEALYNIRYEIDGLCQLIYIESKVSQRTYEIYRSLRLSKVWTTKIIKILNSEEQSSDIMIKGEFNEEPSSIEFILFNLDGKQTWEKISPFEKIDFLLTEIDKIITLLPDYNTWCQKFMEDNIFSKCDAMTKEEYYAFEEKACKKVPDFQLEVTQVYIHLTEAKMFLGFELLNLKDNGTI